MQSKFLNPLISSFVETISSMSKIELSKGELSKKIEFSTEKDVLIPINIEGDLNGYFNIALNEKDAIEIVNGMSEEMGLPKTEIFDEMGKSCLLEIANVLKGKFSNVLSELDYGCEVSFNELYFKDGLPLYPESITLEFNLINEKTNIELDISIY